MTVTRVNPAPSATARPSRYRVAYAARPPRLGEDWDAGPWRDAATAPIDAFHPHSRGDRPHAEAKLLYDDHALYVHFRVRERHLICRHTQRQSNVSSDSCVEFFVQPGEAARHGYFNFEVNCGGTLLAHYQAPGPHGERGRPKRLADAWLDRVAVYHTMPRRVMPAATFPEPVTWRASLHVPLDLIDAYAGPLNARAPSAGVQWRANYYTCAWVNRAQRHWAAWAPIGAWRNFHQPQRFGVLAFA